jgi:virulence-associated protein VagC
MRTKLFVQGQDLAVHNPDEIAFPEDCELEIVRTGDVIAIFPARKSEEGDQTSSRDDRDQ